MAHTLRSENLVKVYKKRTVVNNASVQVSKGEIVGLLGPNGAGKTTTIRMIVNIIKPDAGKIFFDGKPFDVDIFNKIGYLPEERGLYRKNKVLQTILYFSSLKGVPRIEAKKKGFTWLERFDLIQYANRRIEELSKGNQQKIQFIISILHNPDLILLDEPFSGLDPVNQILLKDIINELKQHGKAIIFSTHIMEHAEKLCDRICLIDHGQVVLDGELSEIKKRFGSKVLNIEFDGDGQNITKLPGIKNSKIYTNYAELELEDHTEIIKLLKSIPDHLNVRKIEFREPSLESIFIAMVKEKSAAIKKVKEML